MKSFIIPLTGFKKTSGKILIFQVVSLILSILSIHIFKLEWYQIIWFLFSIFTWSVVLKNFNFFYQVDLSRNFVYFGKYLILIIIFSQILVSIFFFRSVLFLTLLVSGMILTTYKRKLC